MFSFWHCSINVTPNSVKELLKIENFSKVNEFDLWGTSEIFDIETFYNYAKTNEYTQFMIDFDDSISLGYKNRIVEKIDEILATENHAYRPPVFLFQGLDRAKRGKLEDISENYAL